MTELHHMLDTWLREGQPEPAPEPLREHLKRCSRCQQGLAEIEETRGWYPDPGECLTDAAADAIRFQLRTAANVASHRSRSARTPLRFDRIEWAYAAILLLAALGTGIMVSEWLPKAKPSLPVAVAILDAKAGSRVHRVSESKQDEVYRLDSGVVRFSVPKLRDGRRLLVLVGEEMVSVRGTRFEVHATNKRLQAVCVEEGLVGIRLKNGKAFELGAGQTWRRGQGISQKPQPITTKPQPVTLSRKAPRAPAAPMMAHQTEAVDKDVAFANAWQLYRAHRFNEAAAAFDALLESDLESRRSDVLYWSAMAHEAAGRPRRALDRLEELLREYPASWQATGAQEKAHQLARELESQESP